MAFDICLVNIVYYIYRYDTTKDINIDRCVQLMTCYIMVYDALLLVIYYSSGLVIILVVYKDNINNISFLQATYYVAVLIELFYRTANRK